MDEQTTSSRRRFVAGGVAAAGAAGAGILAGAQPAGASVAAADPGEFVLSTIDMSTFTVTPVTSGGLPKMCEGEWGISGNIVLMNFRIEIDGDEVFTDDRLCVAGPDLPATYRPALPLDTLGLVGTAGGLGSGIVVNYSLAPGTTSERYTPGWVKLPVASVDTAVMFFTLAPAGLYDGGIQVGGTPLPFALDPGSLLVGSLSYFAESDE